MYAITKEFHFSASHQLAGLPQDHQCARLHGHNYVLAITLSGDELDKTGFIRDYGELGIIKQWIDANVEHRHLNDVFEFNPTAENMAKYFYDTFKEIYTELTMVVVKETPKTSATYMDIPSSVAVMEELQLALEEIKGTGIRFSEKD